MGLNIAIVEKVKLKGTSSWQGVLDATLCDKAFE
jgi:hypothetical protein